MRGLIRPALFWVARIGLVLSVAAWVVSQWWVGAIVTPKFFAGLDYRGICVVICDFNEWDSLISRASQSDLTDEIESGPNMFDWAFGDSTSREVPESSGVNVPGVSVSHRADMYWGNAMTLIGVRHWLIVTTFALFYAVLKCVYREETNEAPDG